ncbi:MAG TPA: M48 family metalloprotease [Actinoplanes sp.]|nr:M48 family metalloprotease [Actinoplanes sp.]
MLCSGCGNPVDAASGQCVCGQVMAADRVILPVPQPRQPLHPPSFPNFAAWLYTGMLRDRKGALTALLCSWFNVPIAIGFGGLGVIAGAVTGYLGGAIQGSDLANSADAVPVLGTALGSALLQSGGIVGLLFGALAGGLGGLLLGVLLPWAAMLSNDLGTAVGIFLGQVIVAVVVATLYTVVHIWAEGLLYRIGGRRQPSRREMALLQPILADCAQRLQLPGLPAVLIDDDRSPNAFAGTRHIIINQGLLDEFDYQTEPIAAVLCHELTHWRNADTVSALFIRGLALPIYLAYSVVSFLLERFRHPVIGFALTLTCWPLLVTIRYVIMPMQAAGSRVAEYQADQGAVYAGHLTGLRQVLSRFRRTFDGSRNGWENSVCATHPPNELRLERVEAPGVTYPLPDPDAPARPLPVAMASSLVRD